MATSRDDIGVVILAGGLSRRLPGKLAMEVDGQPLLLRVCENLARGRPAVVSCHDTLPPTLRASLPCPVVRDRFGRRGPLGGILSAIEHLQNALVFVAAGDAPFADASLIDRLSALWREGDEALISVCRGQAQPLASLYDRSALRREAPALLHRSAGVRVAIAKLKHRLVDIEDERLFLDLDTPQDFGSLFGRAPMPPSTADKRSAQAREV
ncbi:MAG: molybdenum cofactor guanylyltransferase [Candidatus Eremiobacteraeota bacterium]|nr:molybdenum cofactor guanylyltransferase [Candidatus Eremiobacteraeota bacterium]MBC5827799.1 molybdenum cofactor guanylyltransferase [Candidatus Eremiobacteraeota bacterium]